MLHYCDMHEMHYIKVYVLDKKAVYAVGYSMQFELYADKYHI